MIKLGMLIGERYEIIDKIGTGGMSDVYKAKDNKLNRFVAVKVLKQEYSENKNFVSKFRVEAQAAAGLMHPNIVNVYDVGEDTGIHYIVMELVEGITLKKYIEKKARLSTKEAISIAIQVAMGIEAAHNNHIIHRDIKPQNIIISKEGKVKVTDFGIAKAASSNTITSNVMGSVHYTSPEQARGGFSDAKSDIYSMGITMFEMLTGRVPFNGDTTVAIAIKHIQDEMPSPRVYVPEIPISVEKIILKCTQKSPDRRYQSMEAVIKDLKHSLISPDEDFVQIDEADESAKTRVVPEASSVVSAAVLQEEKPVEVKLAGEKLQEMYYEPPKDNYEPAELYEREIPEVIKVNRERTADSGTDRKPVKKQPVSKKPVDKKAADKKKKQKSASNANKNNNQKKEPVLEERETKSKVNRQNVRKLDSEDDYYYQEQDYAYNSKGDKIITALIVIMAIVIGCIILYFVGVGTGALDFFQAEQTEQTQEIKRAEMPEFVGKNVKEITKSLTESGLVVSTEYVESTEYDKELVISAALTTGDAIYAKDRILLGTEIVLTVSAGANGIVVPDVEGWSKAEGTAKLDREGFRVVREEVYSEEYAKGQIISQEPAANSVVTIGSEVKIVVSLGVEHKETVVSNYLGMTEEEAVAAIEEMGLVVGEITETYSSEYAKGLVCYQSYSANAPVVAGTVIDLKISIGGEMAIYSCNISVQAPSDYAGGNAEIILKTADSGERLWYNSNITSFPVPIKVSNIESTSPYGTLILTYIKNEPVPVTGADGSVTTQMKAVAVSKEQTVQFVKE
ncbi:MAG: Stk1 family PASTA domain-containing Ser/Thr kinase [Lachnospiraceae bacterium]|nr:Stk1 family PASTA domain-containing Ser/Thr kinase [Lachnospiraceae bacterium]